MLQYHGLRRLWRTGSGCYPRLPTQWQRYSHHDSCNRLSAFWTPTLSSKSAASGNSDDGHDLLVQAGFLRQAHSGVFHLLPLGLRVLSKIEKLIDKRMRNIRASKLSLSSLSSQDLWQRSGRLDGHDSEFFKLQDRKDAKFILAPTHEEEITTVVADFVKSYKDLPLRLYQVSRKYRDEARPRHGLLRGREFIMKDLYTFDSTEAQAMETYEEVRTAYRAFLNDIGLSYLVANADSGNMGGTLSHEYHFISPSGEDTIITCGQCDFAINEELNVGPNMVPTSKEAPISEYRSWIGISKDRKTLVKAFFPSRDAELNIYAVKALFAGLDTSVDGPTVAHINKVTERLVFVDPRISLPDIEAMEEADKITSAERLLTKARVGDSCPACGSGTVKLHRAVEIGHTFHLGTRYSRPLKAQVLDASNKQVEISMGCHGIGVSRLIGAVASTLADNSGLNWPVKIAPYGAVIVAGPQVANDDVDQTYRLVKDHFDPIIDDRDRPMGWKLKDADLIGYPFIIILGNKWKQQEILELQCRQLGVKEELPSRELARRMAELDTALLDKLMRSN